MMVDTIAVVVRGQHQPTAVFGQALPAAAAHLLRLVMAPTWTRSAVDAARKGNSFDAAANAPDWPRARPHLPASDTSEPWLESYPVLGFLLSTSEFDMGFSLHFRILTQRRMAAAALAIRLSELDHGRRPETLDELVPDYLPAVPLDPMDPAGGPIRYRPHADPPLLYSVGPDLIDQGGVPLETVDGERRGDMLLYLSGEPSQEIDPALLVRPSLEEAAEQQRNVEEADGQEDQNPDRRRQP